MKIWKRITSVCLISAITVGLLPTSYTEVHGNDVYSIKNDYLSYSINPKTGGFSIETLEGHPQKQFDNDIPLLYRNDIDESPNTSFTTIRIDGEDYIFGRSYGFMGLDTTLGTPVITDGGRSLSVTWSIKGYEITQIAAISIDNSESQIGSIGLSYSVKNNNATSGDISIRVLLDTALGNDVDAPYLTPIYADNEGTAVPEATIVTERVYEKGVGDGIPLQIRGLDSRTQSSKASYLILNEELNDYVTPNKLAVGHWANLANTTYEFIPDSYCDFTNYSNQHRIPDTAMALYWENIKIPSNEETILAEVLYGVGDFDLEQLGQNMGFNTTLKNRISINENGNGYNNDGEFEVLVNIDNSVDTSTLLSDITITAVTDDGITWLDNDIHYTTIEKGEIKDLTFKFKADTAKQITAKNISIGINATEIVYDNTEQYVTYSSDISILLPGIYPSFPVTITEVAPEILYTDGKKNITIAGNLSKFEALEASDEWDLTLVHESGKHQVNIEKNTIIFVNDDRTVMNFSTNEELLVGDYQVVFNFKDNGVLQSTFGKSITANKTLEVSNDPKYKIRTYGLMALVKTGSNNTAEYNFVPFDTERLFLDFQEEGDYEEILLIIRGAIKEASDTDGKIYHTVSPSDGDITINEVLTYTGNSPLNIRKDGDICRVDGNGLIQVIDSINVWKHSWDFYTKDKLDYSIYGEGVTPMTLNLTGAGFMVQNIAGFLVDLKFGELTAEETDDGDIAYGISFGGTISLPFAATTSKDDGSTPETIYETTDYLRSNDIENIVSLSKRRIEEDVYHIIGDNSSNIAFTTTINDVSMIEDSKDDDEDDKDKDDEDKEEDDKKEEENEMKFASLKAEIKDVLYGHDFRKEHMPIGFVGIDSKFTVEMPENLLGSFVSNVGKIKANMEINTLEHYYALDAAVSIATISCEGRFALKQTTVSGKDLILPDNIEFYIRKGLTIPVPPPGPLFLVGLGGGIDNLSDTIGSQFTTLPPFSIKLGMNYSLINLLKADVAAEVSLSGLSGKGKFELDLPGTDVVSKAGLELESEMALRWVNPQSFNMTGKVSLIGGLLSGTTAIVIEKGYFGGYACVALGVPDDIPVIGGLTLAQVEAGVSSEFIGAKVSVIGIGCGIIYYWDGDFQFGLDVDVSTENRGSGTEIIHNENGETVYAVYGSNFAPLTSTPVQPEITLISDDGTKSVSANLTNSSGSDSLLITVPIDASVKPDYTDVTLTHTDSNTSIPLTPDDGNGGGNYLAQFFSDGTGSLYFTITDESLIKDGVWTVTAKTDLGTIKLGEMSFTNVINIPELTKNNFTYSDSNPFELQVDWEAKDPSKNTAGVLDIYLTEDKYAIDKVQDVNNSNGLGIKIGSVELNKDGICIGATGSETITIPDSLANGDYYVVTSLNVQTGGMSTVTSSNTFKFDNPNLPNDVKSVEISYAGDGEFAVDITDADDINYTHYLVELLNEDGTTTGTLQKFTIDEYVYMGKPYSISNFTNTDEDGNPMNKSTSEIVGALENTKYKVAVSTLNEETVIDEDGLSTEMFYYGTENIVSNAETMPSYDPPKLIDVVTNIESEEFTSETNLEISYKFDRPVWFIYNINSMEQTSDEALFRSEWKVTYPLNDGDYIVDFIAIGENKDSITYSDCGDDFPQIGFTVDTKPPILNLVQEVLDDAIIVDTTATRSANSNVVVDSNIIYTNPDGSYIVNGLSEASAEITVTSSDSSEKITTNVDGSFSYNGSLGNQSKEEITITAVDKANNQSQITVFAVNTGVASTSNIIIYERLADGSLEEIENNIIEEKVNGNIELVAVSKDIDGNIVVFNDEDIYWNILYEKNIISFDNGTIDCNLEGETAIRVSTPIGTFTDESGNITTSYLEDYIILNIKGYYEATNKNDLLDLINKSEISLADTKNANSTEIATFKNAIENAKAVYNNQKATELEIAEAIRILQNAYNTFETAKNRLDEDGNSNNGNGSDDNNSNGGNDSNDDNSNDENDSDDDNSNGGDDSNNDNNSNNGNGSNNNSNNGGSSSGSSGSSQSPTNSTTTSQTTSYSNKVTILPTVNGTLETSKDNVEMGSDIFVTATPDDGYEVQGIYVNGVFYGNKTDLTIKNITENIEIKAVFSPIWQHSFGDILVEDWFYDYVRYAYENNYMTGISETAFAPKMNLDRGMMVTLLGRMLDVDVSKNITNSKFEDVPENAYYSDYVDWAVEIGLTYGVGDNNFQPNREITREEMATMIYRLIEYLGGDLSNNEDFEMAFNDIESMSSWSKDAIAYLSFNEIVFGKPDGIYDPNGLSTRAEIATVVMNLVVYLAKDNLFHIN